MSDDSVVMRDAFERLEGWPTMTPREVFYKGWQACAAAKPVSADSVATPITYDQWSAIWDASLSITKGEWIDRVMKMLATAKPVCDSGAMTDEVVLSEFVARVVLNISELPDRTSHEDDPEAMLCNSDEIDWSIQGALEHLGFSIVRAAAKPVSVDAGGMTSEELELFRHTVEQFEDCNETDTPNESLMRWANMGLLECEHFRVTAAGQALLTPPTESTGEPK